MRLSSTVQRRSCTICVFYAFVAPQNLLSCHHILQSKSIFYSQHLYSSQKITNVVRNEINEANSQKWTCVSPSLCEFVESPWKYLTLCTLRGHYGCRHGWCLKIDRDKTADRECVWRTGETRASRNCHAKLSIRPWTVHKYNYW